MRLVFCSWHPAKEKAKQTQVANIDGKRIYLAAALVLDKFCGSYPAMVSG